MLDPIKSPDDYYAASPLLFWVVVAVAARRYDSDPTLLASLAGPVSRLLWATLESVPQSYIVVKALCIICTWPMPISSTSADPTFMLSGMMMQIAMVRKYSILISDESNSRVPTPAFQGWGAS